MTQVRQAEFGVALGDLPAAEWAAAVVVRHSTRTFTGRPVEPVSFDRVVRFASDLPRSHMARVVVVEHVPSDLFTGLVGGYGRVLGAPSAFVMIGNEADPAFQESVGYLGEAAMLEATSIGLDTCWIAGLFDRKLAEKIVELSPGERVLAVCPFGYAQPRPRASEKFLKRMVGAHKRRPVEEIAPGFDQERWPAWAAEGARLARVAPSAANRQPWSIGLLTEPDPHTRPPEATGAVISVVERGAEGNISRRLDCGIAMLHFEVGARLMGVRGVWEVLSPPQVARYLIAPPG
ncbi:MAG TPA: nitroreductase family protein [Thermoleophilia bacterium]|nr:nitroreductase family protein [Thermoleophilia bacterium]